MQSIQRVQTKLTLSRVISIAVEVKNIGWWPSFWEPRVMPVSYALLPCILQHVCVTKVFGETPSVGLERETTLGEGLLMRRGGSGSFL